MVFEKENFVRGGLGGRMSPAFASEHAACQQSGSGQCDRVAVPQRVREIDAFAALLRTQRAKVREANVRLAEMRGRLFGEVGSSTCPGGDDDKIPHSSLGEVRSLFEQLDAETDELLGHIGRLEDLA
jgi:hypothetical protein